MSTPAPRFEPGEMKRNRKAAGMSQEAMAERMQYSIWQYKRWEKGTSPISLANAQIFLDIVREEESRILAAERTFTEQRDARRHATLHALPHAS